MLMKEKLQLIEDLALNSFYGVKAVSDLMERLDERLDEEITRALTDHGIQYSCLDDAMNYLKALVTVTAQTKNDD